MPPDRERKILSAVALALQQAPETRPSLLAGRMGHDRVALAEAISIISYQTRTSVLAKTRTMHGFGLGEMVGRFRIVRLIGSGGMGDVYEAEDTAYAEGRRRVALKTIRADFARDPEFVKQFKQEIGLGQTVTHPNVCRIYDLGQCSAAANSSHPAGRVLFLTMELLRGRTLSQHLRACGPMRPEDALPIIRQVADGLTAAHEKDVVHRDLKPGNIMLTPSAKGGPPRAVVMDFGLAVELAQSGAVNFGPRSGTPDYMSPEQVACEPVGCASDVYSLGIVAYEMVTGRFPFAGKTPHYRMVGRLHAPPIAPSERRPDLTPDWSAPLLRALHLDVTQRYPTAQALAEALAQTAVEPAAVEKERPPALPPRAPRRSIPAAAVLTALLAVGAWAARQPVLDWMHPLPREKRIVVLPFENVGNNEAERAFTDGLLQTLVSQLTELEPLQGSLSIVPVNEVRHLKAATVREASAAFGATLAITGSVERSARGIHIIVNLVDTRHLKQLRSQDFFVNPDEPAEMQEVVVRRVAGALQMELQPRTVERLARSVPASPVAYDYYLRGTGYLAARNGEDHAITEFKLALRADPNYALAHAGLCEAYWAKYEQTKDRAWTAPAWSECQQAIHLNALLARPHVALAILNTGTGQYDEAVRQTRAAIRIDPGSDQAHAELARALDALGQASEAETTLKRAILLRPANWLNYARLAKFYYGHARYGDAEAQFQHVIALIPESPEGYSNLGGSYLQEGNLPAAEKALQDSLRIQPTSPAASNLGVLYFSGGRYAESLAMFTQALRTNPRDYRLWGNLADAYRWTPGQAAHAVPAYRKALELTQEALSVNPKDAKLFSDQSLYLAKSGDIRGGLRSAAKALAGAPRNPNYWFNAAVVYEIAQKRRMALQCLAQAVQGGYSRREVETDPELSGLRRDPRYAAQIQSITN